MSDIKTRVQNIDPNLKAQDIEDLAGGTGNIYRTISIIQKRARQLNVDIKHELHGKLEEFAVVTERIEEIQENKEQIEISKFYEKLPNPTVIATNEYSGGSIEVEYRDEIDQEENLD